MENIFVGLVPSPELPAKIVEKVIEQLTDDLQQEFNDEITWEAQMEVDRLTGAADNVKEIMNEIERLKDANNWDFAIALTDLPVFHKKCVVIADADIEDKIAQISLPAFGLTPTVKNVKYTMIHMIKELYYRNTYIKEETQLVKKGIGVTDKTVKPGFFSKFKKAFRFSTIKRIEFGEKKNGVSVRFLIGPTWGGLPIILSGMTIANQPWSIMPSFKKVVGLAFATGSYMLVFNTLWKLSALYGLFRLILVMVLAIGAMTAWTIFAHSLWEKRSTNNNSNNLRFIYNTSTILTLLVAIILFYISIFILFLFAVIIFVPPDMFEEVIDSEVGIGSYLSLVWLVSSAATVAGAIGAGLENADEVRTSTYGYRQYIRSKAIEEQEKEEEEYKTRTKNKNDS